MDANAELAKYREREERRKQSQKKYRDGVRAKKMVNVVVLSDEDKSKLKLQKKKDYMTAYNAKRKDIKKTSNEKITAVIDVVKPMLNSGDIESMSPEQMLKIIKDFYDAVSSIKKD